MTVNVREIALARLETLQREEAEIGIFLRVLDRLTGPGPEQVFLDAPEEKQSPGGVKEPLVTVAPGANAGGTDEEGLTPPLETSSARPAEGIIAEAIDDDEGGADPQVSDIGSAVEPGAPEFWTLKERLRRAHSEHPEWDVNDVVVNLAIARSTVSAYSTELGIGWQQSHGYRKRILDLHKEHPDWLIGQAEEELGMHRATILKHSEALGITWRRGTPGRKPIVPVKNSKPSAHVESAPPAAPSIVPPKPASPPSRPLRMPMARPAPRRPDGTLFRLRQRDGDRLYLHMSGSGFCPMETRRGNRQPSKTYSWAGTEVHLLKLRQTYPDARDCVEEIVDKVTRNSGMPLE